MKFALAAALTAAAFFSVRTPAQSPGEKPAPLKATHTGDLWFKARQDCRADVAPCEADCTDGNPFACSSLAGKYLSKDNYDKALAVKFAEKACATGDALNCLDAGWMLYYVSPKKVKTIPDQAKRMFMFACEKQDARGCDFAKSIDAGTMPARVDPDEAFPPKPRALCHPAPENGASTPAPEPAVLWTEVEVDESPKPVKSVPPVYPKKMLRDGRDGKVFLLVVVDAQGAVTGQSVLESTSPEFSQAAQAAISQRRYLPGKRCGRPVPVVTLVSMFFKQG